MVLLTRGVWGHVPPRKISNLGAQKLPIPTFSTGVFKYINMRKRQYFIVYFTSLVLSVRWNVYRKKGKTVIPSRRLQAEGKTSALQTGKCTKIMQKIYQSSWSSGKDAFRKWEKKFYCIDPKMGTLSCVCKLRMVKVSHPFDLQFRIEN